MNKVKLKILLAIIVCIVILLCGVNVKATNDDIAILKKQNHEYILYIKENLNQNFYYAFSEYPDAEEGSLTRPLNFITSKEDNKGNQIADISTENKEIYLWIKENGTFKLKGKKVDLLNAISITDVEKVEKITKEIPIDTKGKITEVKTEGNKTTTITQGIAKIENTKKGDKYSYQTVLLLDNTLELNRLLEITNQLNAEENSYDELILAKEYNNLFNKLTQSANWEETEDGVIKQPKDAKDGSKYAVLLKKETNNTTNYDIQFLASSKKTNAQEIEKLVSTKQTSRLPITYDNPILWIILCVVIILIILVIFRIKKISKINKNGLGDKK